MAIKIRAFGGIKAAFEQELFEVTLSPKSTASDLKKYLETQIQDANKRDLLSKCALANESRILLDTDSVDQEKEVAILPPVCGG